jgi:hypothetical protein
LLKSCHFLAEYFFATESTEFTEAGGTRNPKGHRNLLCDIGIFSWNKNKKIEDGSTSFFLRLRSKKNRLRRQKAMLSHRGFLALLKEFVINRGCFMEKTLHGA